MFDELYAEKLAAEEEAKQGGEGKPQQKQKKKGVSFAAEQEKKIRIIKLKRGGKKFISAIVGLEKYGCDLAEIAKKMSKRFGTGAAAMTVEYKEINQEGIQVQGDVEERIEDFILNDLKQYNIPMEMVNFEDGGNKKNRTMGGGPK